MEDLNRKDFKDTQSKWSSSGLEDCADEAAGGIIKIGGGVFECESAGGDSVRVQYMPRKDKTDQYSKLSILTHLEYTDCRLHYRHGLVAQVQTNSPPGDARSGNLWQRRQYWRGGKQLSCGGLVAVVTKEPDLPASVELALVTSCKCRYHLPFQKWLTRLSVPDQIQFLDRKPIVGVEFSLSFIDFAARVKVAHKLQRQIGDKKTIRVLIDSSVLYPSVQPFLEALQTANPHHYPFADYLKHTDFLQDGMVTALPSYARDPGFIWNLDSLLQDEHKSEVCTMDPRSATSVQAARERMRMIGKLDPR